MRLCASAIQQSKFVEVNEKTSQIPYANQAVEYSRDILDDWITQSKVTRYDN